MLEKLSDSDVQRLADALAQKLVPELSFKLENRLKDSLLCDSSASEPETENHFFKKLTEDIMDKLSTIYREMSRLNPGAGGPHDPDQVEEASELMSDATSKLGQIIEQTEKATFDVMEVVERDLEMAEKMQNLAVGHIQDKAVQDEYFKMGTQLSSDLVEIITCMSFQDLTGQRIKRVIDTLEKMQELIKELYLTTGIMLKARERNPESDLEEVKKGGSGTVSQDDVDALMAQLNS